MTNPKPAELILDALDALEIAEGNPAIEVNMDYYRSMSISGDVCFSCLGGAHHLKRLGVIDKKISNIKANSEFFKDVDTLEASLDAAIMGLIGAMFVQLDLCHSEGINYSRDITEYSHNPAQFKADLTQLANDLRAGGY